jgi:peptidoglycan hydrolase CwlO-like protein
MTVVAVLAAIQRLELSVKTLTDKVNVLTDQQAELDQDTQLLDAEETDLAAAVTAVGNEISDLKAAAGAAGATLDFSGLESKIAAMRTAVTSAQGLEAAPASTPTTPDPTATPSS